MVKKKTMTLSERVGSFAELGTILRESLAGKPTMYSSQLQNLINTQQFMNPWFTPQNVKTAINAIAGELTEENIEKWTGMYPELAEERDPITVAVVMAGNIPLVGFHDYLCVLISGNNLLAKASSKDTELIVFLNEILCNINHEFRNMVRFSDGFLSGFDAVIATGSNNTSRYFEYYFSRYPHIIRKNRNSAAIIDGTETSNELKYLGSDVFSYFGLGCRSISKIYIPEEYDLNKMITEWESYSEVINHNKYANNYDYNKAIYLINNEIFIDTGYILLKESTALTSPVAVLFYEKYSSIEKVYDLLKQMDQEIQCISGKGHVPFGKTQSPHLWDYADGRDILEFLLKKKQAEIS
ncbi:MAG: acyl-CoA reductase [Bacteroidales bacterium]|jgi:hypothetical protein